MGLLGMPRRPAARQVYWMPPVFYDPRDTDWHPVLVISLDPVTRLAQVVTRTRRPHARSHCGIPHPAQHSLGLKDPGWWRMEFPWAVSYTAFDDPEVQRCGELDEATWARVLRYLEGIGQ